MKILIVSYYFAPQNVIGAVRPTKLAKYLSRMGHEVTVVCGTGVSGRQDPTLVRDLEDLNDVHVVREWNPIRDRKASKAQQTQLAQVAASQAAASQAIATQSSSKPVVSQPKKAGFVHSVLDTVYVALGQLSDHSFARKGIKQIEAMDQTFDVVLSSYGPVSVHRIAYQVKRKGMAKVWFADFRDEARMPFFWQRGILRRYIKRVRRHADTITAVSQGTLAMMGYEDLGHCLPNGFDREDLAGIEAPQELPPALLRFTYCGQLNNVGRKGLPVRNLTPLFRGLRTLINEGLCTAKELQVIYAGSEGKLLKEQAETAGLGCSIIDKGFVSRQESLTLQKQADVLLLASWCVRGQTGILTGKLLEYFMAEKPIICCISGDISGSETKRMIDEARVGFCYEEADTKAQEQLNAYLRDLVRKARSEEPLYEDANTGFIEQYAYPEIAVWFNGRFGPKGL